MTNRDIKMFPKHGLTRNTKRLVFDALLERQQGKCGICGISLAEIKAVRQAQFEKARQSIEGLPAENEYRQRVQTRIEKGPSPVHNTLHIDHCHITGMIRGLLCEHCNYLLGVIENAGLLQHYTTPAYQYKPPDMELQRLIDWFRWEANEDWLELHRDSILLYMQQERWLPRKDTLFHLQIK